MTTTSPDFVNFCIYNHEPGDLIVKLDILMDVMAKQTDNLVKKEWSDQVLAQIDQIQLSTSSMSNQSVSARTSEAHRYKRSNRLNTYIPGLSG